MGDVASLAVGLHLNAANFKSQLISAYSDARNQTQTFNRTAQQEAKKTAASFDQIGTSLTGLAGRIAGLAGVGISLGSLISINRQYGQSLSDLSAITGATGAELRKYDEAAQEMGRTTEYSANQAAESIKLMASAKPELMKTSEGLVTATKSALVLAQAAGTTLPDATRTLALSLNQFGAGAEQADRYINVLAAGAKYGSSEITDTADAIKNGGVAAAQAGIGFETLNAAIQVLAEREIKGGQAGTALRNVILTLEKGTDQSLKPSVVGLSQALENLSNKNLSTAQAVKLFNVENISAASILVDNRGKLKELVAELTGTNTAYEQASIRVNNLNGDLMGLTSAFEGMAVRIGQASDGALRTGVQGATEAVNFLSDNFNTVANVALYTLLPVLSTKLTAGLRDNVSAWRENQSVVKSAALQQAAIAQKTLDAAQATLVQNNAEFGHYSQMQKNAKEYGLQVSYKQDFARLIRQETEATLAETTAKRQLDVANKQLSFSARAASVAGGLASGAYSLIGGPFGAAMLAGSAILYFHNQAIQARQSALGMKDAVVETTEALMQLSQAKLASKLDDYQDDLAKINSERDKVQRDLARHSDTRIQQAQNRSQGPLGFLYSDPAQLMKEKNQITSQLEDLNKAASTTQESINNAKEAARRLQSGEKAPSVAQDRPVDKPVETPWSGTGSDDKANKQAITQFAQLRREIELENLNSLNRIDIQEQQAREKLSDAAKKAGASQIEIDQLSAQQSEKFSKERQKLAEQYSPTKALTRQVQEANDVMQGLYSRDLLSYQEYQQAKLKSDQEYTRQRLQAQADMASIPQINLAGEVDPVIRLQNQLAQQQALYEAYYADGLISKQRYEELMTAATNQSADQQKSAAIELYRNQSKLHALQMDLISNVGDRTANMITGILTGQQSFSQAMTNMANTIMDTVVKAFIQAQTQAIMFQMVSGATSMFGGSASSASASSAGGSGGMGMSTSWNSYAPGRATGGSVRGGSLYEMGELGIELLQSGGKNYVVPDRDGNVIPTNQLSSGNLSSGGNIIVHQTISVSGNGDAALERVVLQAAEQGAKQGAAEARAEMMKDFRTNGPARRSLGV
ncbi:phage tail tape measure protein [Yersinia enterocolitica]